MKSLKRVVILGVLAMTALVSGCAVKNPATVAPAQTAQQKFVKANNILATATASAVQVTTNLNEAGVLTVKQAGEILIYEAQVLDVTQAIAKILALPGTTWQEQLPQIVAIVAKLPPSTIVQKYLAMNDVQYAALVAALQGVVTTIQIITLEAQP